MSNQRKLGEETATGFDPFSLTKQISLDLDEAAQIGANDKGPAKTVDGLFAITASIDRHTDAVERLTEAVQERGGLNWEKGQAR